MKRKLKQCICFILTCSVISCLIGCKHSSSMLTKTGFFFDTVVTITAYDLTDTSILDNSFSICKDYENMLSRTIKNSDIWNINHSNGSPVTVHSETAYLLKEALRYCELTDGSIDITLAPVSDLWNFSSDTQKHVPAKKQIDALLKNVDYHTIKIDGNTVTLENPNAAIDLGFIAKGYIADKLKEYLLSNHVKSAIINLGGNVLTIGNKPDGSSFHIGIQKPFATRDTYVTDVHVSDCSVVSSGIYERYFKENGELYHHILNPHTGYPYQNDLVSVTILSKNSMEGDALSTTCFVLGLDKGMQVIESIQNTEAIFITSDHKLHYSSGYQSTYEN